MNNNIDNHLSNLGINSYDNFIYLNKKNVSVSYFFPPGQTALKLSDDHQPVLHI